MSAIYSLEEVAANIDKTFIAEQSATVASNIVSIELAAVSGKRHHIQHIMLSGTTGTGGSPVVLILEGATEKWREAFAVGTDKDRPFNGFGWVGAKGSAVTIRAQATNLTAARLSVVGYTK